MEASQWKHAVKVQTPTEVIKNRRGGTKIPSTEIEFEDITIPKACLDCTMNTQVGQAKSECPHNNIF